MGWCRLPVGMDVMVATAENRELTIAELEQVAGGFPWNAVGGGFVDAFLQVAEDIMARPTTFSGSPCGR